MKNDSTVIRTALRKKQGVTLPLEPQAETTTENRLEVGEQVMVDIMGEFMKGFGQSG